VAHNPLIDALGVLTAAAQALWPPGRPIDTTAAVGVADAALKLGLDVWMLVFYPAVTYS
jgi:hypothetical protein